MPEGLGCVRRGAGQGVPEGLGRVRKGALPGAPGAGNGRGQNESADPKVGALRGDRTPSENRYRCSLSGLAGLAAPLPPGLPRGRFLLPAGGVLSRAAHGPGGGPPQAGRDRRRPGLPTGRRPGPHCGGRRRGCGWRCPGPGGIRAASTAAPFGALRPGLFCGVAAARRGARWRGGKASARFVLLRPEDPAPLCAARRGGLPGPGSGGIVQANQKGPRPGSPP